MLSLGTRRLHPLRQVHGQPGEQRTGEPWGRGGRLTLSGQHGGETPAIPAAFSGVHG